MTARELYDIYCEEAALVHGKSDRANGVSTLGNGWGAQHWAFIPKEQKDLWRAVAERVEKAT